VSFAAKRIFQSMLSGTLALDPVILSGVSAALLPSRFCQPRSRMADSLAIRLSSLSALAIYRSLGVRFSYKG
jgi:hypothetical protein